MLGLNIVLNYGVAKPLKMVARNNEYIQGEEFNDAFRRYGAQKDELLGEDRGLAKKLTGPLLGRFKLFMNRLSVLGKALMSLFKKGGAEEAHNHDHHDHADHDHAGHAH